MPETTERQTYWTERQYEFTTEQNALISQLSNSMRWAAVPMYVLGILCAVNLLMGIVWLVQTKSYQDWHAIGMILYLVLTTLLFLAFAFWTANSARAFQQITQTQGRDISHLMNALDGLRKVYSVIATFVKVFIAVTVITLVLNLVGAFSEYRQKQITPDAAPAPVGKP
jgi:hypothetical protein